jgi:mono/diheme cytochrome c family protein
MKLPARLALMMLISLTVACGSARRGEPFTRAVVPANAQLARGEQVFYEHCHKCHTGGEAGLGPALNNKPLPAFMLRMQVRAGLGVMPSFSDEQIADQDLDALVAYLKELRQRDL